MTQKPGPIAQEVAGLVKGLDKQIKDAPSREDHQRTLTAALESFDIHLRDSIRNFPWEFDHGDIKDLKEMMAAVMFWCRATIRAKFFGEEPYWLTLMGPSEMGKTHLASRAISCVRSLTKKGVVRAPRYGYEEPEVVFLTAEFITADELVDRDKQIYNYAHGWNQNFAVAIDDIGTEIATSEFPRKLIYKTANARAEQGAKKSKAMIITTNMDMEEFSKIYDPRFASRLRRGKNVIVEIPKETKAYYDR